MEIVKMIFPAGCYWIGDPCYVLDEENNFDWGQVLDDTNYFEGEFVKLGEFTLAVFSTAYGDGLYYDDLGRDYGVDAGLIALIPVVMLPNHRKFGHEIEFTEPFEVHCEGGKMTFGHIILDTRDEIDTSDEW